MRIIGGEFKGRQIVAPKGDTSRPTTNRNRESLFNILAARNDVEFEGARVLDLFAGSGALGLESLSRGAAWVLFVETNAAARGAIRDNIETLGAFGVTRIHRRSATSLGAKSASAGDPYSIAFLDPPYHKGLVEPALQELHNGGWLKRNALIIVEQAKDETPAAVKKFRGIDERTYGDTMINFYLYDPVAAS